MATHKCRTCTHQKGCPLLARERAAGRTGTVSHCSEYVPTAKPTPAVAPLSAPVSIPTEE